MSLKTNNFVIDEKLNFGNLTELNFNSKEFFYKLDLVAYVSIFYSSESLYKLRFTPYKVLVYITFFHLL